MRYCTALAWIRHRGNEIPVLPWIAVKYLAVAICCLAAFVAIVEWRLGSLAEQGRVTSDLWQREDDPHQSDELRQGESRSGESVLAFGGDLSRRRPRRAARHASWSSATPSSGATAM